MAVAAEDEEADFADVLRYKSVMKSRLFMETYEDPDGDETLDEALLPAVVPGVVPVVPAAVVPAAVAPLALVAATVVAGEEPVAFKQVVGPELHVKTKSIKGNYDIPPD
jgi:hypothetical protein